MAKVKVGYRAYNDYIATETLGYVYAEQTADGKLVISADDYHKAYSSVNKDHYSECVEFEQPIAVELTLSCGHKQVEEFDKVVRNYQVENYEKSHICYNCVWERDGEFFAKQIVQYGLPQLLGNDVEVKRATFIRSQMVSSIEESLSIKCLFFSVVNADSITDIAKRIINTTEQTYFAETDAKQWIKRAKESQDADFIGAMVKKCLEAR